MKTLNLNLIASRKKKMEEKILAAIWEFESRTGLLVARLDQEYGEIVGKEEECTRKINAEVRIQFV